MEDIGTKNFIEDELNTRLGYAMVTLDNWQNSCAIGVIQDNDVWGTRCSDGIEWIEDKLTRMDWVELVSTQWVWCVQWFWINENITGNIYKHFSENM